VRTTDEIIFLGVLVVGIKRRTVVQCCGEWCQCNGYDAQKPYSDIEKTNSENLLKRVRDSMEKLVRQFVLENVSGEYDN
jgi:hypothetical protein